MAGASVLGEAAGAKEDEYGDLVAAAGSSTGRGRSGVLRPKSASSRPVSVDALSAPRAVVAGGSCASPRWTSHWLSASPAGARPPSAGHAPALGPNPGTRPHDRQAPGASQRVGA